MGYGIANLNVQRYDNLGVVLTTGFPETVEDTPLPIGQFMRLIGEPEVAGVRLVLTPESGRLELRPCQAPQPTLF